MLRERLSIAASAWAGDPDALYRGARLTAAQEWAPDRTDLPEPGSRFLAAGIAAEQARERDRQRGVPAATLSVAFAPDDSLVTLLPSGLSIGHWAVPSGRRLPDLAGPACPTGPGAP